MKSDVTSLLIIGYLIVFAHAQVNRVYLNELRLSDNRWTCGCNLGWLKPWRNTWISCSHRLSRCDVIVDDFRRTKCTNLASGNKTLVDAIRHHMDCDSKANKNQATTIINVNSYYVVTVALINMLLIKLIN